MIRQQCLLGALEPLYERAHRFIVVIKMSSLLPPLYASDCVLWPQGEPGLVCSWDKIMAVRKVLQALLSEFYRRKGRGKMHLQDIYDSPGRQKSSPGTAAVAVGRRPFMLSDQMFAVVDLEFVQRYSVFTQQMLPSGFHLHILPDRSVEIYGIFNELWPSIKKKIIKMHRFGQILPPAVM